jgi:hypothetical protein
VGQRWKRGCEVLLRHGADINQRFCRRAPTPLLLAGSIFLRPKFLKLLLDAGADVSVPSYDPLL